MCCGYGNSSALITCKNNSGKTGNCKEYETKQDLKLAKVEEGRGGIEEKEDVGRHMLSFL